MKIVLNLQLSCKTPSLQPKDDSKAQDLSVSNQIRSCKGFRGNAKTSRSTHSAQLGKGTGLCRSCASVALYLSFSLNPESKTGERYCCHHDDEKRKGMFCNGRINVPCKEYDN